MCKILQKGVTLIGAMWCPSCKRVKKYLDGNKIRYSWVDSDENQQLVDDMMGKHKYRTIPMVFLDGEFKRRADQFFQQLQKNMHILNKYKE